MTAAICTSHYWNPLNDYVGRKGKKHLHQNRFRQRQSSRSAFYQPGLSVGGSCFGEHQHPQQDPHQQQDQDQQQEQQSSPSQQQPQETQDGHWGFRPSALQHDDYGRGEMSVSEIVDCYIKDSERAEREGVAIPPRPSLAERRSIHGNRKLGRVRDALFSASSSSLSTLASSCAASSRSSSSVLRCLQWNIQAFSSPKDERNMHTITAGIIRSICESDCDVLVLNEIHWREVEDDRDHDYSGYHCEGTKRAIRTSQALLEELLRLRGYHYSMVSEHGDTPTLIATRKRVLASKEVVLSHNRSALCLKIEVPSDGSCWVVGTHLDAFDAHGRRSEIQTLLEEADGSNNSNSNSNTAAAATAAVVPNLLMGDFNQQRRRDYTPREWERVASSADLRGVPVDDGVANILEDAGFRCVLDHVRDNDDADTDATKRSNKNVSCNWNQARPPPSTHWSGTTIDYTYYSNPNSNQHDSSTTTTTTTTIRPHGVYVGPAGFSDHRMTVTDWTLTTTAPPPPPTTSHPAPRHIDKSFFFNHLPAGRHHSWLYNNTHRQFENKCY